MVVETITTKKHSFWRRQFGQDMSPSQITFDVIAGILLPFLCLIADPIVFKGGEFGSPLFKGLAFFSYLFTGFEICALIVWFIFRRFPAFLGGVMAAGVFFSLFLGVFLLPFSIIGLLAAIGFLGFSPFLTLFVYWRNSVRAIAAARKQGTSKKWILYAVLGFSLMYIVPLAGQWSLSRAVSRATAAILAAEDKNVQPEIARLRSLRLVADLDKFVLAYGNETDPNRRARFADAYKQITGTDIEQRLAIMND